MQRLIIAFLCVMLVVPVLTVGAQDDGGSTNVLAYGDTVTGEITNREFEQIYTFEGAADDFVTVTMTRTRDDADLDPYLYLTTLENDILAQSDDDYFSLNALIIAKLPADGTYQIVATRNGGRSSTSSGPYSLILEKGRNMQAGVVAEGSVINDYQTGDFQFFIPETTGAYTVTYNQVRGEFYPAVAVIRVGDADYGWNETIGEFSALQMKAVQFTLNLDADAIYLFTFTYNYYDYTTSENASAIYTLKVEAAE